LGWLHGRTFSEVLLIAVSLAVSAVPEGLPAVVTLCFAMGVKRMVKKNVIVRKLDSLETLGSVTVICSDKTGTITENRMRVKEAWVPQGAKKGDDTLLLQIAASCNRAKFPDFGDPTELGLLEYAEEKGVKRLGFDEEEVPFSSEKKYMQTRHGNVSFLKGAPEKIVELCDQVPKEDVLQEGVRLARGGLRVLGFAIMRGGKTRFVGLIGMEDPPRSSVRAAIREARQAGIRSIMITGDNMETARAIAAQVGIKGEVVNGHDVDAMTPKRLRGRVGEIGIYARVSPIHKLKILRALQENGEIVAMSGDGVNDAPALKGAHVGIAMGKMGTQVAREASSVVLADDHFSTMVSAVREGRRIYDNIRKFVLFLLQANFYAILFIMATLVLGMPLPYLPIHILWINLITDGLPALALGMEKEEPDIMERPPRPNGEHILAGEWKRLLFSAIIGFAFSLGLFLYLYISRALPLAEVRSTVLMMAIAFELCLVHSVRSSKPIYVIGFFSNRWLLLATVLPFLLQFVIVYTPLNVLFHVVPLTLFNWVLAIGLGVTGFIVFESMKFIPARKRA
ncbi:MAG: HAD-IC family P-type ATPase, partial [Candidatus Peribacteraceae bacterium]|nr:HAD-IC family P-type ATPase [Candidatus Peribacteraceae bacterium]